MPMDIVFLIATVTAFTVFAVGLAWGEAQTRHLQK